MKLLIATVALATLIAAPALAQTANQRVRAENSQVQRGTDQINHQGRAAIGSRHSTNPAHDVYDSARQYLGSDPDARVREVLIFDRTD